MSNPSNPAKKKRPARRSRPDVSAYRVAGGADPADRQPGGGIAFEPCGGRRVTRRRAEY